MPHPTVPKSVVLRRLALARAVLSLIDMADDKDALLAILNGDYEAVDAGGLTPDQLKAQNDILEAKPFSPAIAADNLSKIIAQNHGGGSMVSVATAASIDLARTIRWIDREVSQIRQDSDPRDILQRVGNIRQIVGGVAALLDPASSLAARSHGSTDQTWIAAE